MPAIELRLLVSEPLTRHTIRTGIFPIPPSMAGVAGAHLEREVLILEALPKSGTHAVGTAAIQGVFATGSFAGPAIVLSHFRRFPDAVPVPADPDGAALAELPEGILLEVMHQVARAGEFAEPPQAEFLGRVPDHICRAACEASDWRCNLTGEDIPRMGDLSVYIVPVIPNLFGGTEQEGNLLVVLPSVQEPLLKGAISFDAEGRLLVVPARLAPGLMQRLRPAFALRQPAAPFTVTAATLRRHRELVFCNPSLRD
jgi:hypothetical protein